MKHKELILITVVVTLLATLVYINFAGNEKKVRAEIAHLYPVDDPQSLRSMGLLLGPSRA